MPLHHVRDGYPLPTEKRDNGVKRTARKDVMKKPYTRLRIVVTELLEPNVFTHCLESARHDTCGGVISS